MTIRIKIGGIALLLLALALACGAEGTAAPTAQTPTSAGPPRHYHLGFTPFPYDITSEALSYVYEKIAVDADIIAHHFDGGIPWPEALEGLPYNDNLMDDWQRRETFTPPGHKVYVAITPISVSRDSLALYWGETENMPLPAPWDSYGFNHPDVKTAFLNHAIATVEFFQPDYLAIGIEANLLLNSIPEQWDAYLELHTYVYEQLKARYPDLPIMVSVMGNSLLEGFNTEGNLEANRQAFEQLIEYSDYFAISLYPYLSAYLTDSIPEDMFENLLPLSDKPIAFAETGYPAQSFTLTKDNLYFDTNPEKQLAYFTMLFDEADRHNFVFIINFVLRDYDALWPYLNPDDQELAILWRDTGFYDEKGQPRPVLELWQAVLARPYQD